MLKRLGYFHYGSEDRSKPIGSLEVAINEACKHSEVKDSLIVLPEAFNLRVPYEEGALRKLEGNTEESLKALAAKFDVAFVAGLIRGLCNTACFIAGEGEPHVLSQKVGEDSACPSVWEPCEPIDAVVRHHQACIAALICRDCEEDLPRRNQLVSRIKNCACPVLCIPANTRWYETSQIGDNLPDINIVIANGYPLGPPTGINDNRPSIIRVKGDPSPKELFQDKCNVVRVIALQ